MLEWQLGLDKAFPGGTAVSIESMVAACTWRWQLGGLHAQCHCPKARRGIERAPEDAMAEIRDWADRGLVARSVTAYIGRVTWMRVRARYPWSSRGDDNEEVRRASPRLGATCSCTTTHSKRRRTWRCIVQTYNGVVTGSPGAFIDPQESWSAKIFGSFALLHRIFDRQISLVASLLL